MVIAARHDYHAGRWSSNTCTLLDICPGLSGSKRRIAHPGFTYVIYAPPLQAGDLEPGSTIVGATRISCHLYIPLWIGRVTLLRTAVVVVEYLHLEVLDPLVYHVLSPRSHVPACHRPDLRLNALPQSTGQVIFTFHLDAMSSSFCIYA